METLFALFEYQIEIEYSFGKGYIHYIYMQGYITSLGATYFDRGVFPSSHSDIGFDTPLGHPSLPSPFGLDAKTPQDVSDEVFNVTFGNNGNSDRVPHLMMTFGQFLDHDFAYSLHQDACDNRYGIVAKVTYQ